MKTVLYTCTFLDYDQVFSPARRTPGVDYVLFSDRRPRLVRGWRWSPLPEATRGLSQTMTNRYCKFFPHRLFPDADCSIYVDGNTLILGDLQPLLDEFTASGAPVGLFLHAHRRSVYEELGFCKTVGRIRPEDHALGDAQIERYRRGGLPDDHVLTENGVIFRRHDAPGLEAAMALWWEEMNAFTRRDQLSLPWALHVAGIRPHVWPWRYRDGNPYFRTYAHADRGLTLFYQYIENKKFYGPAHNLVFSAIGKLYAGFRRILPR